MKRCDMRSTIEKIPLPHKYSTAIRVKSRETGQVTESLRCSYCMKETQNEQIIQDWKITRQRMVGKETNGRVPDQREVQPMVETSAP